MKKYLILPLIFLFVFGIFFTASAEFSDPVYWLLRGTNRLFPQKSTYDVAIGTSTPYAKFTIWGAGIGTGKIIEATDNASTTRMSLLDNGTLWATSLGSAGNPIADSYFTNLTTSILTISSYASGGLILATSTTPDLRFQYDTDTGLEWLANDKLSLYTGNSARLVIDSSGNVGIGSTSPLAKLVVKGSGTTTGLLAQFTDSADTARVTILDNGNVGIGTTSPGSKLELGSGQLTLPVGSAATPSLTFSGDSNSGIYWNSSDIISIALAGAEKFQLSAGTIYLPVTNATLRLNGTYLVTDDNNFLAQRNAANAQTFRLYNTYTNASNYERLAFAAVAGSAYTITPEAAGTGTVRNLALMGGNVGIGTTSPYERLSVSGNGYFDGTLTASNFTATSSISAPYFTATSATATSTFAGGFAVDTNGLVFDWNTNNVGIGVTGTTAKLEVYGEVRITDAANLSFVGASGTQGGFNVASYNSAFRQNYLQLYGGSGAKLTSTSSGNLSIGDGATDVNMYIQNNGNVGIGTTNPGSKLDISGAAETTFTNNPRLVNLATTNAMTAGMGAGISFGGTYNGALQATFGYIAGVKENGTDSNYAGKLIFGTRTHGSGAADMTRMVIDSLGNVGIGTTSPSQKLSVQGNVLADAYIEYSPIYEGNALEAIRSISSLSGTKNGNWAEVDHSTLPEGVKYVGEDGFIGRDLGKQVQLILKAVRELDAKMEIKVGDNGLIENAEISELKNKVSDLEKRIEALEKKQPTLLDILKNTFK